VIKKLGAKYEGLNRDFRFVYGEYRDVLCFSILDREFKKRKKK
jgi:RimJ/RimL family protein N-acetyltransferase